MNDNIAFYEFMEWASSPGSLDKPFFSDPDNIPQPDNGGPVK